MVASKDKLFPLTDGELAWLIEQISATGHHLDISFGVGGAALNWKAGTPMPEAVQLLGLKRGVLNENLDGAGI